MADKELDCRGLACPNPVLRTKAALEAGGVERITVLVDNAAARENVTRFLQRFGYRVSAMERDGIFSVLGSLADPEACVLAQPEAAGAAEAQQKILVLLATDRLGRGDDALGAKLVVNFLTTLKELGPELWRLLLVNAGVKLAVAGAEVLGVLQELEQSGVKILVCGTCLNHFQLLEQKRVGETTNMLDIVTSMQLADKVISLT
ncbi:MAG: SirA family protein [Syntrophobacteraceae bacterium CG2_30_61_12]|nr:MAG: SirA family protein [Syntrophobacteraceae bacterium CG2_30_61_12]